MARFQKPKPKQGKRVKVKETGGKSTNRLHPAFCFKYLRESHNLEQCDKDEKAALSDTLASLGKMSWSEIQSAPRHGRGHEKISRDSLNVSIPGHIPGDRSFLAFRFCGKKPVVGYRIDKIFYILWIDRDFSVYPH